MHSRRKQKGTQQQAGEREESEALSLLVQSNPSERTKHVDTPNAVWTGPVSTLLWVPLSAYAADGKPAACSKRHAVQGVWGIVRWGLGDFMRTRYRSQRFSTSLQEIWRTVDIHWPINEDAL
jgi:hypothetical protein